MADIELVIKVPNNYDLSKIKNGSIASKIILDAVKNGTPLPKGHGKLIDATILRRGFVVSARFNGTWNLGKTKILSHIDDATAIIEADNY